MYTDWETSITIRRNTRDNHRYSRKLSIEKDMVGNELYTFHQPIINAIKILVALQAQRLLNMIETVPNYNPLMYDPDYIAQLESQLEVAIPAIFDLLQADYANFIQSKDLADYLYAYLSPLKTKDGNNITKSFIDCFLLKDLHDNILQLSAKEILLYAGLRILFLNLIGETWNEYSRTVNRKMNRNQNLLEYYKAARESMQCLFIKDIKRINKKIEKYNHKVDHDGKYMILPEMLPVILS